MEFINRLKPGSLGVKWVTPDQMHLTLKFLGEQPASLPEKLRPVLEDLAQRTLSFPLSLGPGGCFPPRGEPRVLWVGLSEGAESLSRLVGGIEDASEGLGLPWEERQFRPHLTVGRVKFSPARFDREMLAQGVQGRMLVKSFALVESRLGPAGPTYRTLRTYALKTDD